MLSANGIAGFLNQPYLINLIFGHDDVNSRNIKDDFEIFNKTCPKECSAGRFHDS